MYDDLGMIQKIQYKWLAKLAQSLTRNLVKLRSHAYRWTPLETEVE